MYKILTHIFGFYNTICNDSASKTLLLQVQKLFPGGKVPETSELHGLKSEGRIVGSETSPWASLAICRLVGWLVGLS